MLFNKEGPLFVLLGVMFVWPHFTQVQQPSFSAYYGVQYYAQGMTAFVLSIILKKSTARDRPVCKPGERMRDLRGKEICNSWPSGDTCQAAVLVAYMLLNFSEDIERLLPMGKYIVLSIVPHTAFARVYFRCHFIGDVLGGVLVGALSSISNHYFCNMIINLL